jgi:hypothetical protein
MSELVPEVAENFTERWLHQLKENLEDADLQELLTVAEYSKRWNQQSIFQSTSRLITDKREDKISSG